MRAVIGRFPWWIQHGKLVVFVLSNMARSFSRNHVGLNKASIWKPQNKVQQELFVRETEKPEEKILSDLKMPGLN